MGRKAQPKSRETILAKWVRDVRDKTPAWAARKAVNAAVAIGLLTRPELCEKCGRPYHRTLQGHHEDYTKPLEVMWLCQSCHSAQHYGRKSVAEAMKEAADLDAKFKAMGMSTLRLRHRPFTANS